MIYSKKGLIATAVLMLALTYSPLAYAFNIEAAQAYNNALDLYINGSTTEAIEQFEKAVTLDPDFADAYYNLGSIYRYTGDVDKALDSFQKALELNPGDSNINYDLGLIYIQKKDYNKALSVLKLVKESDDKFNEAQNRINFVQERLKATDLVAKNPIETKEVKEEKSNKVAKSSKFKKDEVIVKDSKKEETKTSKVAKAKKEEKEEERKTSKVAKVKNVEKKEIAVQQETYTTVEKAEDSQPVKVVEEEIAAVNFMAVEDSSSTGKLTISPKDSMTKNKRAKKFNGISIRRSAIKTFADGFNGPTGIVRDQLGNMYVANYSENKVYKIDSNGNKTLFAESDDINGPIGLAIDEDNNIFVANYLSNSIAVIEQNGKTSTIVTGLKKPYFVYFDQAGSLYVSEQESNTISKININGKKGI